MTSIDTKPGLPAADLPPTEGDRYRNIEGCLRDAVVLAAQYERNFGNWPETELRAEASGGKTIQGIVRVLDPGAGDVELTARYLMALAGRYIDSHGELPPIEDTVTNPAGTIRLSLQFEPADTSGAAYFQPDAVSPEFGPTELTEKVLDETARLLEMTSESQKPLQPLVEELRNLVIWTHGAQAIIVERAKKGHRETVESALAPIALRLGMLLAAACEKQERDENTKQLLREYEDEQLKQVEKVIQAHEDRIRISHCGGIAEQLASLLEHYHSKAVQSMSHTERFQQELLVNLRALALIANSVAEGHTHSEKNARIRGLISMLESAYHKISQWRIDVQSSLPPWSYENVFRADYPAQHYLRRISDLEAQLAKATGEPVKHSIFPQQDTDPFSDRG